MSEIEKTPREELKQLTTQEMEARDRRGYEEHPEDGVGIAVWEQAATWPDP